jgi:hypothetical protein
MLSGLDPNFALHILIYLVLFAVYTQPILVLGGFRPNSDRAKYSPL